jgi:hypothetical protein
MNLHLPQSYETKSEISNVMMVPFQIVSPQKNAPVPPRTPNPETRTPKPGTGTPKRKGSSSNEGFRLLGCHV